MESRRDRKPVWLPTALHRELKIQAAKEGLNMAELIADMLRDRQEVDQQEKNDWQAVKDLMVA